ncbi:DUF4834 family protein [Hymenobacter sp. BT175]|uniref:DUF4834 family protein n=1 Tax=Hymenobacter translucens TaxID=2886507 RepID=UPI001D0EA7C6|nr:DUF4834 family protein [Hymenobacter translucens]MCC2546081.1 DUF4834 family protein [Hymenobacter translucens]
MPKFLLTLLIISLLVRFVLPVVLRFLVGMFLKKQARRYGVPFGGQSQGPFARPAQGPPPGPSSGSAGELRVEYVPPKQKPTGKKEFRGGDYVDFEEIK